MEASKLQIRNATGEDALAIAELHVEGWRTAYRGLLPDTALAELDVVTSAAAWQGRIQRGLSQTLVATSLDQVVGFTNFGVSRDEDALEATAELFALYVANLYQRRGVGAALCRAAEQALIAGGATVVTLWLLEGNRNALAFYEKVGFTLDGSHKVDTSLIGSPLPEQRMRKRLAAIARP